ncbi:hypothetical protein CEXT_598741 [Caerostris extrusa]|uniref:Uncharacterized protein n=1 Tax=Caerostris extrusa TaxID=172846 RepID=A0AAV4US52_CAEEX|nr:hypothetical protein CEXT_598741 [Caerostris extrusa]
MTSFSSDEGIQNHLSGHLTLVQHLTLTAVLTIFLRSWPSISNDPRDLTPLPYTWAFHNWNCHKYYSRTKCDF